MILDFHSDSCISDLSGFGPGIYVPPSPPWLPLQLSPQQDLGGLGASGFFGGVFCTSVLSSSSLQCHQAGGQADAQALMPKLPPRAAAAEPGTLLFSFPALVAGDPSCTVRAGRGRRGSCPAKKLITLKANTCNPQTLGDLEAPMQPQVLTRPPRTHHPSGTFARACSSWAPGTRAYSSLTGSRAASQQQAKQCALRLWPSWNLKESARSPALCPRTDLTQVL